MKTFFTSFFCLLSITIFAQTLTIIDAETREPVADMAIYNKAKNKSSLSKADGTVTIDVFALDEVIYFQHPSYLRVKFTKKQLIDHGLIVNVEKQVVEIEEFVISAYRWEQNREEVPNKIAVISRKEIEFENPQTAADLLAKSNEVFVQKSQLGGGSPMIRGFSTNKILLVIDGVRMNNAIYREGNLQNVLSIDANAIENSEVIFGPGSVTYGSDALGGVMDFHTLHVKLATGPVIDLTGNALTRYSSANNEKTAHLDFNIATPKLGFLTSLTYSDFGDLVMGSKENDEYQRKEYVADINGIDSVIPNNNPNKQIQSGYNQVNFMQKIRFMISDELDFVYAFHYSKLSDVPRYDKLIEYKNNVLRYGDWYYGPQKWMMHSLNMNYTSSNLLFDELKLTLAYQDYEESRHDRKFRSDELFERTEQVGALSFNLDFDKNLKRDNQLFYGFEAVYNSVTSTAHVKDITTSIKSPADTRYPDGINNYTTLAAYLSYKENFSEKFTAITGIRFNYVSLYSTLVDTTFFSFPFDNISLNTSALNGSLGVVYKPVTSWQIHFNASSGFHAPNLDDMGKIFESEPGNVVVPNENLKPEYAYNVDLGVQKDFSEIATVSLTGFYTLLNNAIVRRDFTFNGADSILYEGEMSNVLAMVNTDKATLYGFNGSIIINLPIDLKFETTINYTHGEDQDGVPMRHAGPWFGSTRLSYIKNNLKASFYANYNGEISYKNLPPCEQEKSTIYATDKNGNPYSPSWYTLNFLASYNFKFGVTLNAGVENILDVRYRPYSSGIVSPGRNFIIGLRANF
ncbi:MAG: TonB-dependent receptor [Bacteroidales bacterium]|jgi:hemoglobin/transferrin/lactoferrin receptor protein|nr:TonB-dependent receptor [Bacteroidales bacterium]